MGIPYSREINAAFESVTPLVASAYEVLETTKNIAVFITFLQIYAVITLTLILTALVGLLITTNPDLDKERKALVTPVMKWIASWIMTTAGARKTLIAVLVFFFVLVGLGFMFYVYYIRNVEDATIENEVGDDDVAGRMKGKDVDALKKGESEQ